MKIPSRRCDAMPLMNEIRALDPLQSVIFFCMTRIKWVIIFGLK